MGRPTFLTPSDPAISPPGGGRWWAERVAAVVVIALAVVLAYEALFAWDSGYNAEGAYTSGPYSAWQVALMVLVLGALTAAAAMRRLPVVPVLTIPVVLGAVFAADWGKADQTGLYALGVLGLVTGSFLGVVLVALTVRAVDAAPESVGA